MAAKDLKEWYASQYVEAVALKGLEGGDRYEAFMSTFPAKSHVAGMPYPMAGRARMSGFSRLRMQYPISADGYLCLAMTARVADGEPTIYAYAYWRRTAVVAATPEYVCTGSTYDSRDGEYRDRFVAGAAFEKSVERFASDLAPIEAAIVSLVAEDQLQLDAVAYPENHADDLVDIVSQGRLPIVALAVSLAYGVHEWATGLLSAHASADYVKAMRHLSGLRPSLVAACATAYLRTGFRTGFGRSVPNDITSVMCGQKIVPLFAREVMFAGDYNLAAWRELAVTRLASDLVINYVSPSFAIYNNWTYVEDASASLFVNPAMKERYVRGAAVAEATRALREARAKLAAIEGGPNWRTEELSARLYSDIEYAQSFAVTSSVAILHTMENVGRTVGTYEAFLRHQPSVFPSQLEIFADYEMVVRTIFELCYGAHCLHTKLGVAHTDLHTNNMTLYTWGTPEMPRRAPSGKEAFEDFYEDPIVAYVAGPRGEADTYVFPASGISACIIDYSRAILGPAFRPRLAAGRSEQYATNFYRDQVNRVMRTLHRYAAVYVERNQEALKAMVIANFESVFPLLCVVDYVAIGRNLAELFRSSPPPTPKDKRTTEICREASRFAEKLKAAAQEILLVGLQDLVAMSKSHDGGAPPRAAAPARGRREFPGNAIFQRIFGEWAFPRWAAAEPTRLKRAKLVDAYNFNNELRYSGEDYARFPPWARVDEIERHLGAFKMTELFERGVEPFLDALAPNYRVEVIAEEARSAQERLDGAPVATNSSWIEE